MGDDSGKRVTHGACAGCGHDPACGFASVHFRDEELWFCHADDHTCYLMSPVTTADGQYGLIGGSTVGPSSSCTVANCPTCQPTGDPSLAPPLTMYAARRTLDELIEEHEATREALGLLVEAVMDGDRSLIARDREMCDALRGACRVLEGPFLTYLDTWPLEDR